MRTLPPATNALLIGGVLLLSNKRVTIASLLTYTPVPYLRGAPAGQPFVPAWASSPTSRLTLTTSPCYNSLLSNTDKVPSHPDATLSNLGQWRKPYKRWVRCTPDWGPLTNA